MLAQREHSTWELQQKLQQKTADQEIIKTVLTDLAAKKLLSDARFVEAYISMRTRRGYGPVRIAGELRERGISSEIIAEKLAAYQDQWRTIMKEQYQKKFGQSQPENYADRARQARFLQYRGFTVEQIKEIIDGE